MKCGFADSRSFISSFKQVYHTTPSKYRTSLEGISDIENRAENRKAEFFKDRAGDPRLKKRKKKGQNHEMLDEMEKMINNFFSLQIDLTML